MRIAIIDDDRYFYEVLIVQLRVFFPDAQIECYQDISDNFYQNFFDILFLDVMLSSGKSFNNGQKILERSPSTILVYISRFDRFVYESYSQRTFFFIRKSVLESDLKEFMKKYKIIEMKNFQFITIKSGNQELTIPQKDIICIESCRNKSTIKTPTINFSTYLSLKNIYEKLNKTYFYRLNSHTIINLDCIVSSDKNEICLNNGLRVFFTRNSRKIFLKVYLDYISRDLYSKY